jgi:hypothetical protein
MPREPEIRELAEQPAAVDHAVTDAAGLPATIDRGFPALFGQLAKLGVTPSGPPFIRFLEVGERFEIQLGVPVPPGPGSSRAPKRGPCRRDAQRCSATSAHIRGCATPSRSSGPGLKTAASGSRGRTGRST